MMGEVPERQLLVAPAYPHVPSKNCNTAVGMFAKGIFQPILHVQSGNVFQREEVIIAKEASGSSALALRPGLCMGWRDSAVAVAHIPRHSSWTGPGSSRLLSSSSPTDIEGVLNPALKFMAWKERRNATLNKFDVFIYGFIFTSVFACCPYRWKQC